MEAQGEVDSLASGNRVLIKDSLIPSLGTGAQGEVDSLASGTPVLNKNCLKPSLGAGA